MLAIVSPALVKVFGHEINYSESSQYRVEEETGAICLPRRAIDFGPTAKRQTELEDAISARAGGLEQSPL